MLTLPERYMYLFMVSPCRFSSAVQARVHLPQGVGAAPCTCRTERTQSVIQSELHTTNPHGESERTALESLGPERENQTLIRLATESVTACLHNVVPTHLITCALRGK